MFGHHPFSAHSIGDVPARLTFSSIFNVALYVKKSISVAKYIKRTISIEKYTKRSKRIEKHIRRSKSIVKSILTKITRTLTTIRKI